MDYGHTAQNQSGEPSFFTAGVGNSPEDAPLSGPPNLESGIFLDEQDYSGRGKVAGNIALQSHELATNLSESTNPSQDLGRIQDLPMPPITEQSNLSPQSVSDTDTQKVRRLVDSHPVKDSQSAQNFGKAMEEKLSQDERADAFYDEIQTERQKQNEGANNV